MLIVDLLLQALAFVEDAGTISKMAGSTDIIWREMCGENGGKTLFGEELVANMAGTTIDTVDRWWLVRGRWSVDGSMDHGRRRILLR